MSLYAQQQHLRAQIIDTERLLKLTGSHTLMSQSLSERVELLKEQLNSLESTYGEAKITLLFSGSAVKGSLGIKSNFVSSTLTPIQELIKTQASRVRFGSLRTRTTVAKSSFSELYMTALQRGSFGYELTQLETSGLFDEVDVSASIEKVIELIDVTAKIEETFLKLIEDTPKKSLVNLGKLFKAVAKENSILKIESGNKHITLTEQEVKDAAQRISSTIGETEFMFVPSVLRGFLLESGRFEIVTNEGVAISGLISDDLDEEQIVKYDKQFLNEQCVAHLQVNSIQFANGKTRKTYELIEIFASAK